METFFPSIVSSTSARLNGVVPNGLPNTLDVAPLDLAEFAARAAARAS